MVHVFDQLLVIALIIVFAAIGYFFRSRHDSNIVEYFLARKQLNPILAGFSISVTFISSVTFTVNLGEIYTYGTPSYLHFLSAVIAFPIVTMFVQPRLYHTDSISSYQYLHDRFSPVVKILNSSLFLITSVIHVGIVGYSAAISAEILSGIPYWTSAVVIGLLSTGYSAVGGIKGVVWTDMIQALIMILSLCILLGKAFSSFENFAEFWDIVNSGQRTNINFSEHPTRRYTAQSYISRWVIFMLFTCSLSQPGVQRWRSVRTLNDARIAVLTAMALFSLFAVLQYLCGISLYAFYARCAENEWNNSNADKLSLHFMSTQFSGYYGVIGLCLAGILSGALSTASSFLNSQAAVTFADLLRPWVTFLTERQKLRLSTALTVFYGIVCTASIFAVGQSRAVYLVAAFAMAFSNGPPLGTLLLGLITKRANTKGVISSMIVSVAFLCWLLFGSYKLGIKYQRLPPSNQQCSNSSTTIGGLRNNSYDSEIASAYVDQSDFLSTLYGISFNWYPFIGFLTSAILGFIFSMCYTFADKVILSHGQKNHVTIEACSTDDDHLHSDTLLKKKSEDVTLQMKRLEDNLLKESVV